MTETRRITHEEAKGIAQRLINSAWRHDGEPYVSGKMMVSHIPARPDLDDDLLIHEYIRQQEEKEAGQRYVSVFFHTYYQDGDVCGDSIGFHGDKGEIMEALKSLPKGAYKPNYCYVIDTLTGELERFEEDYCPLEGGKFRWKKVLNTPPMFATESGDQSS
jgi:hypothetical protein